MKLAKIFAVDRVWIYIIILFFLQSIVFLGDTNFSNVAIVVNSIMLIVILGWSLHVSFKRSSVTIWTALFWFRIAAILYVGFGGMAIALGGETAVMHAGRNFSFNSTLYHKSILVDTLGVGLTLFFSAFFLRQKPAQSLGHKRSEGKDMQTLLWVALSLIFLSGVFRYLFLMPYYFGISGIISGMLITLGNFFYIGIAFLGMYSGTKKKLGGLLLMIVVFDFLVSSLTFSKYQMLFTPLFAALGYLSFSGTTRRLVMISVALLLIFSASQDFIRYGRSTLADISGEYLRGNFSQRIAAVSLFFEGSQIDADDTAASPLMRLSYVDTNAFAVSSYDQGDPGSTYRNFFAVFVPRVLWPEKPVITSLGTDFYRTYSGGNTGSSFGMTLWAEAYWNWGWYGPVVMSFVLAYVISTFSSFALKSVFQQRYIFFPVIIIGITVAMKIDAYFVPAVVGPTFQAVVYFWFIRVFRSVTFRRRRQL